MELTVNGEPTELPEAITVRGLLTHLDLPGTGIAVAIEGMVRPAARWDEPVAPYSRVDIVTAVQGG